MSNCLCPIALTPIIRGCEASYVGGIAEIYISPACSVDTVSAANETQVVTAITMVSGATFTTFQQRKSTANMVTNAAKETTTGVVTHTTDINLKFNKLTAANRLNFLNLAKGETIVIVKLLDGSYWIVGSHTIPCELSTGSANSGTAMNDMSGYDVTLQCADYNPPLKVEMANISTILDIYAG